MILKAFEGLQHLFKGLLKAPFEDYFKGLLKAPSKVLVRPSGGLRDLEQLQYPPLLFYPSMVLMAFLRALCKSMTLPYVRFLRTS